MGETAGYRHAEVSMTIETLPVALTDTEFEALEYAAREGGVDPAMPGHGCFEPHVWAAYQRIIELGLAYETISDRRQGRARIRASYHGHVRLRLRAALADVEAIVKPSHPDARVHIGPDSSLVIEFRGLNWLIPYEAVIDHRVEAETREAMAALAVRERSLQEAMRPRGFSPDHANWLCDCGAAEGEEHRIGCALVRRLTWSDLIERERAIRRTIAIPAEELEDLRCALQELPRLRETVAKLEERLAAIEPKAPAPSSPMEHVVRAERRRR